MYMHAGPCLGLPSSFDLAVKAGGAWTFGTRNKMGLGWRLAGDESVAEFRVIVFGYMV